EERNMVIQNSEVSMTSKSSIASGIKLSVQTEQTPVFNVEGVKVLGGDEDFMSSLSYAKSPEGNVKEVSNTNPLINAASNRTIRMRAMEYLFRMLVMGGLWGENCDFQDMFEEAMGTTSNDATAAMDSGSYTGMESLFVQKDTFSISYWENSSVEFSSTGTAITADGRKLSFDYSFAMSDSFMEKTEFTHTRLRAIDPLVINLDDCPTSIANQTFFFDLDADGQEDEIHNVAPGSGFLALDRNEDGVINDGLELFGARTGDGFRELAELDEDGNGWIDENDSIFQKLRIMTVNENGERELYGLKESDVGAIFLGRIDTNMNHHDDDGNTTGIVRKSGLFLHEKDGHAGGVQHVDFTS
ncbi:hypothetical protein, partial [Pseudobutyrivibrio sp.]|uniref:hypothetical protein n=1 Tax=Pseudobutyrivibrio sp. TaxID=2014367 RepID=UPI0025DAC0D5